MPYGETKVYFDGSHYIAIPHTTRPVRPKRYHVEEEIEVIDNDTSSSVADETPSENGLESAVSDDNGLVEEVPADGENPATDSENKPKKARRITRKELFDELYQEAQKLKKHERKKVIFNGMRPYFETDEETTLYVNNNIDRKKRNVISRRIRMTRKANLQRFNYFCTFTYDSKLHTEESFRKCLKKTLSNFCSRKGWKYIGVWERSPEKERLHFHGLLYIPDGTMPGFMFEDNTYSFSEHKRQITLQNMYFKERFGRNDFEAIEDQTGLRKAMRYIMKYIEKSGDRIVYSKGLPQFFISDIMDEDIICPIGMEDQKLLLFDDFSCWDEGCLMGQVSPEVIAQMRTVS